MGVQDILGNADLESLTLQLSLLADALIDAAVRIATVQVADRFPVPPITPFAVIGLGKLGGSELNYSSDIDVMFVYGEEGEGREGGYTYHEYFNALAERITQNLSRSTGEGHLYRVDTRLRPESGAGPLARALQSYLAYYESRGELWERQMLIKARPVAGDRSLGEAFLAMIDPFVYPRSFFHHPAESVARIKARIESSIKGEANIKLMRGGIRDIEFLVQTLQLLNGGRTKQVRTGNTLKAIRALSSRALLSAQEEMHLTTAYTFYRTLEHRLQVMLNTQTHELPSDTAPRTALARRAGLRSDGELTRRLELNLALVRKIFDQVLTVRDDSSTQTIKAAVDGGLPDEAVAVLLKNFGFRDLRQASRTLKTLSMGSALTDARELDTRARDALRKVVAELFEEIRQTPDPDMTLANLAHVVSAQRVREQFYSQLGDKGFRKFLLDICSQGSRLARALSSDPLMLETLAANPQLLAQPFATGLPETDNLLAFKTRQEVRVGIRHILGFSTFEQFTAEVTALADCVITRLVSRRAPDAETGEMPFAVFALGKYGSRELLLRSDLDLMFVARTKGTRQRAIMEKLAERILGDLTAFSDGGSLYEVDARLRPEGKNAPLLVDVEAYERYLLNRALLWERQALTRCRFVCGDPRLGEDVLRLVGHFVYESPLPAKWTTIAVEMRRKMEGRQRTRLSEVIDLKTGAGGMVDVEFVAQWCAMKAGAERQNLRNRPTVEVVEAIGPPWISSEEASSLIEAYRFYRIVEKTIRIMFDERSTLLPEERKLEILSRALSFPTSDALRTAVRSHMKATRTLFLRIADRFSSGSGQ